MVKDDYDSTNLAQHVGKVYVTKSGTNYFISSDGRLLSTNNASALDVLRIAGVSYGEAKRLKVLENPEFDKVLSEIGRSPEIGMHLAASFSDRAEQDSGLGGVITSEIQRIKG